MRRPTAAAVAASGSFNRTRLPARFRVESREALRCSIKLLQAPGSVPDPFAIADILSDAAKLRCLDEGRQTHALLVKRNAPMDLAVTNSLINMYFKCECVRHAEKVFNDMPQRDVYTWTAMVSGYGSCGMIDDAIGFFRRIPERSVVTWNATISACEREGFYDLAFSVFNQMRRLGEVPNGVSFVIILKVCSRLREPTLGEGTHGFMAKSGWSKDALARCTLLDMYAKCGQLDDVEKVFEEEAEEHNNVVSRSILLAAYAQKGKILMAKEIFDAMPEKNLITWNVMISGYIQGGLQDKAFGLCVGMVRAGRKPNTFSITSLLSGCSSPGFAKIGKMFHGLVIKEGLCSEISICNSMITMYGDQGSIGDSRAVFMEMPGCDVVSWTAMLAAYVADNDVIEARSFFDKMPEKNLISWNTMMFGYLKYGKIATDSSSLSCITNLSLSAEEAWMFYYEMEHSEVHPDHFTYNCALSSCASLGGGLEQTRMMHCRILKRGFESDTGVGNALITAYGKCGCLDEARRAFDTIITHDMISWNTLLTGYTQNGRGNAALDFYKSMQSSGVKPNHVTFITLISACSYTGELKKAKDYLEKMVNCYGIFPNKVHYTCLIDLLGRAGLLYEAEAVIRNMAVERDSAMWAALLGAAKLHGEPVIAMRAAEEILQLEPLNSAAHVALAETFAASKMWGQVADTRAVIREKKLVKEPGCSWTEIRSQKHIFLCKDLVHPESKLIYSQLSGLYANMVEKGFFLQDCQLGLWYLQQE